MTDTVTDRFLRDADHRRIGAAPLHAHALPVREEHAVRQHQFAQLAVMQIKQRFSGEHVLDPLAGPV